MSQPSVYYNDSEPFVCDWLENLIREKLLPDGVVDRRPIQEVAPSDVQGFTQCHFFAGIGGWALALGLGGWPTTRPVWTGSCPCQPFSAAGKRGSHADARHLWPAWFRLIQECRPVTVFGEQVSGAAGLGWLDAVAMDLEAADYAVGACVLGAHSVGAPHIRQRLWFVGESEFPGLEGYAGHGAGVVRHVGQVQEPDRPVGPAGISGILADADGGQSRNGDLQRSGEYGQQPQDGSAGGVADPQRRRRQGTDVPVRSTRQEQATTVERRESPWTDVEWLPCRDGKARPVEPGTFPLAHGIPQRVGRLRAYGNAIVPQVAAAFVSAYMEIAS